MATFVLPEKRARYVEFLANPKHRQKILERLNHHLDYDETLARELSATEHWPEPLERLLRSKGADDTCHVIADGLDLDGQKVPLTKAIDAIFSHEFGAIACCVPGRLAYYKPEPPSHGLILEKKP